MIRWLPSSKLIPTQSSLWVCHKNRFKDFSVKNVPNLCTESQIYLEFTSLRSSQYYSVSPEWKQKQNKSKPCLKKLGVVHFIMWQKKISSGLQLQQLLILLICVSIFRACTAAGVVYVYISQMSRNEVRSRLHWKINRPRSHLCPNSFFLRVWLFLFATEPNHKSHSGVWFAWSNLNLNF